MPKVSLPWTCLHFSSYMLAKEILMLEQYTGLLEIVVRSTGKPDTSSFQANKRLESLPKLSIINQLLAFIVHNFVRSLLESFNYSRMYRILHANQCLELR